MLEGMQRKMGVATAKKAPISDEHIEALLRLPHPEAREACKYSVEPNSSDSDHWLVMLFEKARAHRPAAV